MMTPLFDLTGRTVVVIGAGSTLGSVMADALHAHGAQVALVARNIEKAEPLVKHLLMEERVKLFQADTTVKADLEQVLEEILAWSGRADIMLHAAGTNSATPFFDITEEEWDYIMDVNAKSVMLACQVFGRSMIDAGNGGSIITISSVSSGPPLSRVFTYSASKHAVNSMTQFLAREFAPHGVRVNAIIPGFFPAEQNKAILSQERVTSIMSHTPMSRFGNPKELQGAVVWLASEAASSFVTGSLIRVDGGFGAMSI
ncbi:D-mannonate oxidoreductase [Paenibacillus baekrokdamisoli]|uniref:D-mannonate oxidoreductase n=1 Tax=Paenibacillus baekrokdamisoli TaxID=1712516 RepID=A0A3G9JP82_9BACL|nr:SDR family oxidoreductase [Paenibacillus baekrokdamisoli]MBB3071299.1 NAD(P)-dependent dehydrogenase (short-subunit alcohol dehydrogenase family) [Paenibacillus baekrokdamisoli]BBH24664.1 D-mannonate oxidoreductase [Paenibacillus baekrokdamisoli]